MQGLDIHGIHSSKASCLILFDDISLAWRENMNIGMIKV